MSSDEEPARDEHYGYTPAEDVSKFGVRVQNEFARIKGQTFNDNNYEGIDEQNADDILYYHGLELSDKSAANQRNHLQHLRVIAQELDGDRIIDQTPMEMNKLLLRMERDRGWTTDPPGSRRNHAVSVAALLRSHGMEDEADEIKVPTIKVEEQKVDIEEVPKWEEHVLPAIEAEPHPRNKAIIATTWEGGCRVGQISAMKVEDYEIENDRASKIRVPAGVEGMKRAGGTKKGLVVANIFIDKWLVNHPCDDDPDAALFCSTRSQDPDGSHISPTRVREIVQNAAERIGLDKENLRINPHYVGRHSRTTWMRSRPEFDKIDIETNLDWSKNTVQHERYTHTDADEEADRYLAKQGIDVGDGPEPDPVYSECPRCGGSIATGARYCEDCGTKLDGAAPGWFSYYRRIVSEDDPLIQTYKGMAGAIPDYAQLPRSHFQHVRDEFMRVTLIDAVPDSEDWPDDWEGYEHLLDEFSAEEVDLIHQRWLGKDAILAENYLRDPAEYELAPDNWETVDELQAMAERAALTDDDDGTD